ncbi:hypothetical protein GCM10029992_47900 [Glycomyces albus]
MASDAPSDVLRHVSEVSSVLADACPDLIGIYLHGSAALGGFRASRSDVDVLAVIAAPLGRSDQQAMGEVLAATGARCPGMGLEMSVITAATAARLDSCTFEVHVRTNADETVVIPGADSGEDADLILHCAVCRERALAVQGPPAAEVFGPVPADRLGAAILGELRWGLDHGEPTYAVLNSCRALRFAEDGQLVSKVEGGRWYQARHGDDTVVTAALAHQREGLHHRVRPPRPLSCPQHTTA